MGVGLVEKPPARPNYLFGEWQRTDRSYARPDESWFDFLDRVDDLVFDRVRRLIDEWYSELPPDKAANLRDNFVSGREEQVEAAFLELLLHAAFGRTPLELEVEPGREEGRQPDFRCWPPDHEEHEFFAEARLVGDRPSWRAREKRLKTAFEHVNRAAPQDFTLWVQITREGAATPGGAELRREIVPWLAGLDRAALRASLEADGARHLPRREITVRDWVFDIQVWPWSDEGLTDDTRRLVGIEPARTAFGASKREFAKALKSKKARYAIQDRPYVIVIGNTHSFQSADDPMDTLYGDELVQIHVDEDDEPLVAGLARAPNGLFRPNRNRRVSAVLHLPNMYPWSVAKLQPELWVNPFAHRELGVRIPWADEISVVDGQLTRTPAAVPVHELFGLSSDWPGPERPFRT